jgi:hypothetical protein
MTTAADNDGTQDREADYKGEGGERAANNNGIRASQAESVKKIKKLSLRKKTFFSNTVCPVGFLLPPKHPMVPFRFISLSCMHQVGPTQGPLPEGTVHS